MICYSFKENSHLNPQFFLVSTNLMKCNIVIALADKFTCLWSMYSQIFISRVGQYVSAVHRLWPAYRKHSLILEVPPSGIRYVLDHGLTFTR